MIIVKIWGQNDRTMSNLVDVELAQLKDDNEPVIVLINSEGGILSDAIAICNLLNAVPNKKITIAIGACASAAAMIFACGKTRYVAKDAQYMIHQPLINPGDGYLNYTENGRIQKRHTAEHRGRLCQSCPRCGILRENGLFRSAYPLVLLREEAGNAAPVVQMTFLSFHFPLRKRAISSAALMHQSITMARVMPMTPRCSHSAST